jgi:hypothetical protein
MKFIFNLTQFDIFLSTISFVDVVAPLNGQKLTTKIK